MDGGGRGSEAADRLAVQRQSGDGWFSGYVTACRPDFDYQESVRILPTLPTEDGLSFAADTIFITEALPGQEGRLIVESCR